MSDPVKEKPVGTCVIDEKVWPIDRIYLEKGRFTFDIVMPVAVAKSLWGREVDYAVHGGDGVFACRGRVALPGPAPEMLSFIRDTDEYGIHLMLEVEGKQTHPGQDDGGYAAIRESR